MGAWRLRGQEGHTPRPPGPGRWPHLRFARCPCFPGRRPGHSGPRLCLAPRLQRDTSRVAVAPAACFLRPEAPRSNERTSVRTGARSSYLQRGGALRLQSTPPGNCDGDGGRRGVRAGGPRTAVQCPPAGASCPLEVQVSDGVYWGCEDSSKGGTAVKRVDDGKPQTPALRPPPHRHAARPGPASPAGTRLRGQRPSGFPVGEMESQKRQSLCATKYENVVFQKKIFQLSVQSLTRSIHTIYIRLLTKNNFI